MRKLLIVPLKWEQLQQWREGAGNHDGVHRLLPLFVRQEDWKEHHPANFGQLVATCRQ